MHDLEARVQDDLEIKIVSNAKAHSERGRVERRIRVPITCLQWETLFSGISNAIDNLPIARGILPLNSIWDMKL